MTASAEGGTPALAMSFPTGAQSDRSGIQSRIRLRDRVWIDIAGERIKRISY